MKPLKVSILLMLQIFVSAGYAQENWKLSVDKGDIKIYTRPMLNSKINAIKVEFSIPVSSGQLVSLIMDVEHSDQWLYHCKSSRVIKAVSQNELYSYTEVSVPWPVKNRDFVSHLVLQQNPKTKVITIDGPAVNRMVPEKNDIIRIKHSSSKWTILPITAKSIKVTYELEVDPEGSIPAWLVNLFAIQGPLQTFQKIKMLIDKPQYKNTIYSQY
jgi:ribosome-associated toxin RatA of RatAB toxin-antitoxin module